MLQTAKMFLLLALLAPVSAAAGESVTLFKAARVFDGDQVHADWLVAGRALVATGSYGPKGFHERVDVPLGAQAADGFVRL